MRLSGSDTDWLAREYPGLRLNPSSDKIEGELTFHAAYESCSGKVWMGDDTLNRGRPHFLCDTYSIQVELDSIDANGWPKVRETGGRFLKVAKKERVKPIDLHFYSDGQCCMGINFGTEPNLTIEQLLQDLLIPFLYRLSFTDAYGIEAAKKTFGASTLTETRV